MLQAKFQSLITDEKLNICRKEHLPPPPSSTSTPYTASISSHQTDEEEDLTQMNEIITVDELLYRNLK